jgi:hypothetical protein
MAFAMYPGLTQGAISALFVHGTPELGRSTCQNGRRRMTGTMNLTEPQCGTDLGLIRTKAVRQGDGSYRSPAPRSSSRPASTISRPMSSTSCWRALKAHLKAPKGCRCSGAEIRAPATARSVPTMAELWVDRGEDGIHGNSTCDEL